MYGFIYITTNTVNGNRYIGKCSYRTRAPGGWQAYLGSGKWLKRAIRKYGSKNFTRTILEECQDVAALNEAEKRWITRFDAVVDPSFYNIVPGGSGVSMGFQGKSHTEEHKEWLRQRYSGKRRPKHVGEAVRRAQQGRIKSIETVEKHRAKVTGKNHFRAIPVTVEGITYETISAAKRATGYTFYKIKNLSHTG